MTTALSTPPTVLAWFVANREGMLLGALVALGLVGLMLIARTIGQRMVATESEATKIGWRTVIGRVLARTTISFMVVAAIAIVATYAVPPPRVQHLVDIMVIIVAAFQAAIWARELILAMIAHRVGDDPGATTLGNAMSLIRILVSVVLFALAIVVILDNLGVNVTALVAGLGIGGIAIGLAAQGIFSDLFAALAILFDRPFRRGDTIRFDKTVGTVERIGLKTTRMRALSGEQVIMANTKLLEREIHNLADGRSRRTTLTFGLAYTIAPEILARIPDIAQQAVEGCKGCKFIRCAMTGFAPSSIEHELLFDNRTLDADRLAADRSAIMLALVTRFAAEGVAFALPAQIAFTAAPDGTLVMPYADES
ncbi:MAG: mechanosensitive ion channel family protein [Sphingomonas bacterium]|nr:mechanosensitive ion channel family protein [Sphingomonas bacterium]